MPKAAPLAKSLLWFALIVFFTSPLFAANSGQKSDRKGDLVDMKTTATQTITIESAAFQANKPIPKKYTEDGENISPPLKWSGAPEETKELAMIVDDPDAPRAEPWVHWVIYKIPPQVTEFSENMPRKAKLDSPKGALQGQNTSGKTGYDGPAPPHGHGTHHYHFRIYALDEPLQVEPGLGKAELRQAMQGHILAQGEIVGTYER